MRKIMNDEIKKYPVYYLEERFDCAGNKLTPYIGKAYWIESTKDYDHCSFELHHIVPFTDWEKNTKNVRELASQALILLPKIMHQHLENPVYKLTKEDFIRVYKINPNQILFDVNSKIERDADLFNLDDTLGGNSPSYSPFSFLDLTCFEGI